MTGIYAAVIAVLVLTACNSDPTGPTPAEDDGPVVSHCPHIADNGQTYSGECP